MNKILIHSKFYYKEIDLLLYFQQCSNSTVASVGVSGSGNILTVTVQSNTNVGVVSVSMTYTDNGNQVATASFRVEVSGISLYICVTNLS